MNKNNRDSKRDNHQHPKGPTPRRQKPNNQKSKKNVKKTESKI